MCVIQQADDIQQKAARYREESKSALQEAAELQQQAIELLLYERDAIDKRLAQLGYGQEKAPTGKRRGRKPKILIEQEVPETAASHF
jgi:hypothetical protein